MSRKRSWAPPGAPIERPAPTRLPKVTLHVFSEGESTEIGWLAFLQRTARELNISIEGKGGAGVPVTVAAAAIAKREELTQLARKEEVYRRDEVWAVFDRDDHALDTVLTDASNAGIGLVFSNACFELWPLLHVEDIGAYQDRSWLQHRLKEVHPVYNHDQGADVDWPTLGSPDVATERAIRLHFRSPDATTWTGGKGQPDRPRGALSNPTTSAWLLHRRCIEYPTSPARLLDLGRWEQHHRYNEILSVLVALVAEPTRQAAANAAAAVTAQRRANDALGDRKVKSKNKASGKTSPSQ